MPLVILSGWPLAGKSSFAAKLKDHLSLDFGDIEIVSDEGLGLGGTPAADVGAAAEKKKRAAFMAAVERRVSKDRLVIADGCNEIKGLRYQLYCMARAANTPHACIHVLATPSDLHNRNSGQRQQQHDVYPASYIQDLVFRFEEPNGQARWDCPLFHVQPDGTFPHLQELRAALRGSPAKQPSLATRKSQVPADYVQGLECCCRQVIDQIQLHMSTSPALSFKVNGEHQLRVGKKLTGPELQRLKRQFIQMNRQTACAAQDTARLFVDYINKYAE